MTTLWRNRRASILVVLVPTIILISWKGLVEKFGGPFVLSNCITVGLTAIGLMGYTNTIARDRDKGIFQRLRVAPTSTWTIMASRLTVQLMMIVIMTLVIFIVGYKFDGISISAGGYAAGLLISIIGGAVYLSLGQVIVGLIKNPETVNVTTRLVYFAFIMIGMFGELGVLGKEVGEAVKWSPYGTVRHIVSTALTPSAWNNHSWMALLVTLGYTIVFTFLGVKWFRWNTH
jgi:ABC-2 type transport system permease protein